MTNTTATITSFDMLMEHRDDAQANHYDALHDLHSAEAELHAAEQIASGTGAERDHIAVTDAREALRQARIRADHTADELQMAMGALNNFTGAELYTAA